MLGIFYSWDFSFSVPRTEFRVSYMGGTHSTVELHPSRRFLVGDQELDAGERDEAVKSGVWHHMEPSGVSGGA